MSKLNGNKHIKVEFEEEIQEMNFKKNATYEDIKEYVMQKQGFKVTNLYIAQVKRKYGLIERENYNISQKENQVIPKCTPEKERAIEEALEWFGMKNRWYMAREKEFKTVDEQIELLETRELKVNRYKKNKDLLLKANYFNLINGFEALLLEDNSFKKLYKRKHINDHKRLHSLDRTLAKDIFYQLTKVEVELKTKIAYYFSKKYCNSGINTTLNYLDPRNYNTNLNASYGPPYLVNNFYTIFKTNADGTIELNYKKTHPIFLKSLGIYIKVKSLLFTGTGSIDGNKLTLTGKFEGDLSGLKRNIYDGIMIFNDYSLIKNSSSIISNLSHLNNVRIEGLSSQNIDAKFEKLNYSDQCKISYPYISEYVNPPFWVIINTFSFNDVIKLFVGLDSSIQNEIVEDLGFDINNSGKEVLLNILQVARELRNHVAHNSLVTLFETSNKLNIHHLVLIKSGRTSGNSYRLKLFETLKVLSDLKSFSSKKIKAVFLVYILKNLFSFKSDINKKLYQRIGIDKSKNSKYNLLSILKAFRDL